MVALAVGAAAVAQGIASIAATASETVFLSTGGVAYASSEQSVPTALWWTSNLIEVRAGWSHVVALDRFGRISTWGGRNTYGQLGISPQSSDSRATFTLPDDQRAVAVAAGNEFSMALSRMGTVYTWGRNNRGQLGDGSKVDRHAPQPVIGLEGVRIVAIAAGRAHALALTADGMVYAWGTNNRGQLGIGTYEGEETQPRLVTSSDRNPIRGALAIATSAFSDHSLAIVGGDRRVLAWGENNHAQLGTGSNAATAWGEYVLGLSGVRQVVTGESSSYALAESGRVYAWSSNEYGKLGDGSGRHQPGPTLVDSLRSIELIAAGRHHAHAVGEDGTVMGWGFNESGQLGSGDTINRSRPTAIRGFWIHEPE
jgi:alpha-tubulin suppressor-like RCC1 family protein